MFVAEPSVEDTVNILRGLKDRYEVHHGVRITDQAIVSAAKNAQRYLSERRLPDSAVDLIDEAASRLKMQQESKPEQIDDLDHQLMSLRIEVEALRKEKDKNSKLRLIEAEKQVESVEAERAELVKQWNVDREKISEAKEAKKNLEDARRQLEIAQRSGKWEEASRLKYQTIPALEEKIPSEDEEGSNLLLAEAVTAKDVLGVVARATGIPIANLLTGERERLLNLEDHLRKRVVGQEPALEAVSNAVRLSRSGLNPQSRPIGSFLFLGPTGVGKTELCKALAEFLFDDENAMVRMDMSEYSERHSVSRLVGAPPGYVGYEDGGQLTEAVRRRPYQLVLLDEFEKAHPQVATILLQVLDDGRLTDGQGRTVDFRNTILVLTANIGAEILAELPEGTPSSAAESAVMEEVRGAFKPEFINRIDSMILFNRLGRDSMASVVDVQLGSVRKLLKEQKLELDISEDAIALLAIEGYSPAYGARPLRRVIHRLILEPLAKKLLEGRILTGETVHITVGPKKNFHIEDNHAPEDSNDEGTIRELSPA